MVGFVKSPVVKEREVVSLIPAYELPEASSKQHLLSAHNIQYYLINH